MNKLSLSALTAVGLAILGCKTTQKNDSDIKFGTAEHRELGQDGYELACEEVICPAKIDRQDQTEAFTYGELVALSGDFYESWQAVNEDKGHSLFPFDANFNDIAIFRKAVEAEYAAMQRQEKDSTVSLPDKSAQYTWAFGVEYAAMATKNVDHFGWHNMKRYVADHSAAIEEAIKGFKEKSRVKKADHLRLALLINGFADHFLTDGFASGHVRVPRSQGLKWGATRGWIGGNPATLGVLSKILHDHDHRYAKGKVYGLKVLNASDDPKERSWYTRSDGQLYIDSNRESIHRRLPTKAVQLSVKEVLDAFHSGKVPSGVYAATKLVPFIDPKEQPLAEAFNPKSNVQPYIQSAGLLRITLTPQNVTEFFAALPDLMEQFRADVAGDIMQNPMLSKHLPKAYLDGFRNVQ